MEFGENKSTNKNQVKSSWLDDDEWADLRTKTSSNRKNKGAFDTGKDDEKVEVNIKLSLPKFRVKNAQELMRKVKVKKPHKIHKRWFILICLIAISVVVFIIVQKPGKNTSGGNYTSQSVEKDDIVREKPTFSILYPGGKNEDDVGGIVRISPSGNSPVYTYIDTVAGTQVNVSQQQLPDNFKTDQEGKLKDLADSFQAKNYIKVDDVSIYHGENSSGVQSLIFIKANLLFTIRSAHKQSDDVWAAYVSALHN